jgi:hypothetical protein
MTSSDALIARVSAAIQMDVCPSGRWLSEDAHE